MATTPTTQPLPEPSDCSTSTTTALLTAKSFSGRSAMWPRLPTTGIPTSTRALPLEDRSSIALHKKHAQSMKSFINIWHLFCDHCYLTLLALSFATTVFDQKKAIIFCPELFWSFWQLLSEVFKKKNRILQNLQILFSIFYQRNISENL